MRKIFMTTVCFTMIVLTSACNNAKEIPNISNAELPSKTNIALTPTPLPSPTPSPTPMPTPAGASKIEIDALRKLYIDFPQTSGYKDAITFIQASELPYSEKKETSIILPESAMSQRRESINLRATLTVLLLQATAKC